MGEHGKKAKELFMSGYNCSQAVLISFSDVTGLDEKTAAMLASGFGGGIGRMREVCGTVSGMVMVLSLATGYSDPADNDGKKDTYAAVQALADKFKEQNGSIICRELLGLEKPEGTHIPEKRTAEYYKKRPCADLAQMAADILEEYLIEKKIIDRKGCKI